MAEKIEILWTNRAKKDLKNIYEFSCQTIEEPKAFDIVTKLIDKVEVLYSFPLIGQKEPKFEELKHHYRRLILSYYKIIYHQRNNTIYINRVFNTRQNPKKLTIR